MDKKTKILISFLFLSVIISTALTYSRTVVVNDFEVEYSEPIDYYEDDININNSNSVSE